MQVDPAEPAAARAVVAQHLAQRRLAPGRRVAAVEEAVRMVVLAARDRRLPGLGAALGDEARGGVDRRRIAAARSAGTISDGELVVGGVARRLDREVAEVAVQVDVLVRRAPPPGEAPGIEAVDVEHGDAGVGRGPVPVGVFEQGDLHARAAEALDAVAGAADDEQRPGVARPVAGDVHRQHLAVAAGQRMDVGLDAEAADPGGGEELVARFGVALREEPGRAHRALLSASAPARLRPGAPRASRRAGSARR